MVFHVIENRLKLYLQITLEYHRFDLQDRIILLEYQNLVIRFDLRVPCEFSHFFKTRTRSRNYK